MKCRKCHAEIPDKSNFCCVCGVKQTVQHTPKKRGNGQGYALKRGNTWTAYWTTGFYVTENGKSVQKRKSKGGFKTKKDALIFAANPAPAANKVPTLRTYWEGWERTELDALSKSKQTAFKIAWGKLRILSDVEMDSLTIDMIQGCIDEKAQTYYPAKDMKTILSHLFRRAVAEGNARTNLTDFIKLPRLEEKEMQPFTEDELKKLWDAYGRGDIFIGFVLLMVYSGMMPGELLTLKIDMIDWEMHEIRGCGLKTKKRKKLPSYFQI